jgi:hypothetical protein
MTFLPAVALFVAAATYLFTESLQSAALAVCVVYLAVLLGGTLLVNGWVFLAKRITQARSVFGNRRARRYLKQESAKGPVTLETLWHIIRTHDHQASVVVEWLQACAPGFATSVSAEPPATDALYLITGGWRVWPDLDDWYNAELEALIARTGAEPMLLPQLAAFLRTKSPTPFLAHVEHDFNWFYGDPESHHDRFQAQVRAEKLREESLHRPDPDPSFAPRDALTLLKHGDAAIRSEDRWLEDLERETEATAEAPMGRRKLFVLRMLMRSVSDTEVRRRVVRHYFIAEAQTEFAEALGLRDPVLETAYRRVRTAYHDVRLALDLFRLPGVFLRDRDGSYDVQSVRRIWWTWAASSRYGRRHLWSDDDPWADEAVRGGT